MNVIPAKSKKISGIFKVLFCELSTEHIKIEIFYGAKMKMDLFYWQD